MTTAGPFSRAVLPFFPLLLFAAVATDEAQDVGSDIRVGVVRAALSVRLFRAMKRRTYAFAAVQVCNYFWSDRAALP
jgi:hypothetical protein